MFRDHETVHTPQMIGSMHPHVNSHACADVPSVSYLGNGYTDCAEIGGVFRDQSAMRFTQVRGRVYLYVRMCMPLPYLENGWTDCAES